MSPVRTLICASVFAVIPLLAGCGKKNDENKPRILEESPTRQKYLREKGVLPPKEDTPPQKGDTP